MRRKQYLCVIATEQCPQSCKERKEIHEKTDGRREYKYADAVTTVITYDVQSNVISTKTVHYAADGSVMKETFTSDGETTVTEYTYLQSK